MDVCMMVYWGRVHDDMFETCIRTFRKHSDALLVVFTDDDTIPSIKDMNIRFVPKDRVEGRRCLCKIECLSELISQLDDGDRLFVSDIDMYFLDDPFTAFEEEFDMGVTTRCYEYILPINAGAFYFRINQVTRDFMAFRLDNLYEPTWDKYRQFELDIRGNSNHPKQYPDWWIDQDFLCASWFHRTEISEMFGLKIVDVGWYYNYCPGTDVFGIQKATQMIRGAYEHKSVCTLHLKSELKLAIYDGYMQDAVNKKIEGIWNWKKIKSIAGNTRMGTSVN